MRPVTPHSPRFGAHMSIAGGMHRALHLAAEAGCDCVQVFVKNQRQWSARPFSAAELEAWNEASAQLAIAPAVAHATYLINLASPDAATLRKSKEAFVCEIQRCNQLGIQGLVVHPGAHLGQGEVAGCAAVAASLRECLERTVDTQVQIWLEITAGQGSSLGCRFEHLGDILAALPVARVGVCFDTCHAVAAGYGMDTPERYRTTFDAFDRAIGLNKLRCFHLNDSARELGSRVDRHAHIGKGHVGLAAFRQIVNDPRFRRVPMILETPKGTDPRGRDLDRVNLGRLRRLLNGPALRQRPAPSSADQRHARANSR